MKPADAMDTQLRLHDWWGTPDGERYAKTFGEQLVERHVKARTSNSTDAARMMHQIIQSGGMEIMRLAESQRSTLARARCFSISEDAAAYAHWTHQVDGGIPVADGFAILEGGVLIQDVGLVARAVSWSADAVGVEYGLYHADADLGDDPVAVEAQAMAKDVERQESVPPLWLFHRAVIRFDQERDLPKPSRLEYHAGGDTIVAPPADTAQLEWWLINLWKLQQNGSLYHRDVWPGRHQQRRFARATGQSDRLPVWRVERHVDAKPETAFVWAPF